MKYVYLVCFLALLQVTTCEEPDFSSFPADTEASTDPTSNLTTVNSEPEQTVTENSDNSSSTEVMLSNGTDSTTGGEEVDTGPYTQATDDATVSTKEPSTTIAPKPVHGFATLVHPSFLAIMAPICIRIFSTELAIAV